jgi:hypothetical protein
MDKISPLLYITDTDPVPEAVLNASGWFATEWIAVDIEQTETKSGITVTGAEYIPWFLAQGWVEYRRVETYTGLPIGSGTVGNFAEKQVRKYRVDLYRRKLQSERVLNDMIREFTEAYNEGRTLNDSRYDEIVALYNVMLDKSENEIAATEASYVSYDSIIAGIIAGLPANYTDYKTEVDALLVGYGASLLAGVNTRFDNELATARQNLVNKGMYNSTIWTSVSAGIEVLRSRALADANDTITGRKLAAGEGVQRVRMEVANRIEAASFRFVELKRTRGFGASEFRNNILSAMLNFMERRTDEYPGLDGLAGIAAQLGYGEGGTVRSP